jgi:hypothetical protein
VFLRTRSTVVEREAQPDGSGVGFHERPRSGTSMDAIVACFRNKVEYGVPAVPAHNVAAHITYKDEDGLELGEGIPRAAWLGHYFDFVDFGGGDTRCVIIAAHDGDGWFVPFYRRQPAGIGAETLVQTTYRFEGRSVSAVEVQLVDQSHNLLLPTLVFDCSMEDGRHVATLRQ